MGETCIDLSIELLDNFDGRVLGAPMRLAGLTERVERVVDGPKNRGGVRIDRRGVG
jgi:hypothetical protein